MSVVPHVTAPSHDKQLLQVSDSLTAADVMRLGKKNLSLSLSLAVCHFFFLKLLTSEVDRLEEIRTELEPRCRTRVRCSAAPQACKQAASFQCY